MKKALFALALGMFGFAANAQWEEEDIIITGSLSFSDQEGSVAGLSTSGTGFGFGAQGGYFIMDELAVGLTLGYADLSQGGGSDSLSLSQDLGLFQYGAFARYYVPYKDKFAAYAQYDLTLGSGSGEQAVAGMTADLSISQFYTGVSLGFSYMFTDNIFMDLNWGVLGYTSQTLTQTIDDNSNEVSSNAFVANFDLTNVSLRLGLMF